MKTYTTLILLFTSIAINAAAPDEAYVGDVLEVVDKVERDNPASWMFVGFINVLEVIEKRVQVAICCRHRCQTDAGREGRRALGA